MPAALLLPLMPHLWDVLADPAWIPFILLDVLYADGGIVPLLASLVVTYPWCARTGRIR